MEGRGVVLRRTKGYYFLKTDQGEEVECKVKGSLFQKSRFNNQIAVGDHVEFTKADDNGHGLIKTLIPRKSFLSRARIGVEAEQVIAANIDYLLMVVSIRHPSLRPNLINRMLVAAKAGNITPIIVITKTDLMASAKLEAILLPYRKMGIEILLSSTEVETDDQRLLEILSENVTVLSGQSGVGKSSLLNKHFPQLQIRVGAISERTMKGSHTTTYAEMHQITEKGYVVDTPGIRGFSLWKINRKNLHEFYPMIEDYHDHCRFRGCQHVTEPQCAVKLAVEEQEIPASVYEGYLSIYDSLGRER